MRMAAVDIGSNTIRLLVAEQGSDGIVPIRHERRVTRLASGMHISGLISQVSLDSTVSAVREFCSIARSEGADRVLLAATSAVREAGNSSEAIGELEAASGLHVLVLSGDEEARTTAMGVLEWFKGTRDAVIFDIGGGSTEFIEIMGGEVLRSISYAIGVVGLLERAYLSDPPEAEGMGSLDREASGIAQQVSENFGRGPFMRGAVLIGTAGTATTLASLDMQLDEYDGSRVQGYTISIGRIRELEREMIRIPLVKRQKMRGMEPERADLIIAGTRLTIRAMEALGFSEMTVSDHGLLEGLIVRLMREGWDR